MNISIASVAYISTLAKHHFSHDSRYAITVGQFKTLLANIFMFDAIDLKVDQENTKNYTPVNHLTTSMHIWKTPSGSGYLFHNISEENRESLNRFFHTFQPNETKLVIFTSGNEFKERITDVVNEFMNKLSSKNNFSAFDISCLMWDKLKPHKYTIDSHSTIFFV